MLLHAIVHFICSYTNGSASFLGKSYERINDGSVSCGRPKVLKLILFLISDCVHLMMLLQSLHRQTVARSLNHYIPKRTFKKIASLFLSLHHE